MEDNSDKKKHEQSESGQYQDIWTQMEPSDRILDIFSQKIASISVKKQNS